MIVAPLASRQGQFRVLGTSGALGFSRACLLAAGLILLLCAAGLAAAPADASPEASLDAAQLAAHIDRVLNESWAACNVTPAGQADEAEFLRRAHLDLVGKIPSVAELEAFLADTRADKRALAIEDLLGRGAHAHHFANTWRGLMLAGAPENVGATAAVSQLETWLRLRFAVNMPYDQMVTELLTFNNEPPTPGAPNANVVRGPSPAAFFQAHEQKPEQIAAAATRIFLGVQVQCAQCHDHPFSDWKRQEFWSLTAFFVSGTALRPAAKADAASENAIQIPDTEIVVEPRFLDGTQPDWSTAASKRAALARWMTGANNPFFARAAVNRLWDHFLGRGFVHPVDDLDKANPPVQPELLDLMARQFVLHGYDLNYLVRAITSSRAYLLSSRTPPGGEGELAQFAHLPLRRMTADQLFASIVQATGFREAGGGGARRGALPDLTSAAAEFRNRFADQAVPRTEAETSILQALALMNGKLVSDATDLEKSETLCAVADAPFLKPSQKVEVLFMAALARKPAAEELSEMAAYVEKGGTADSSKKALADVFWALLNSAEFALNH